MIIYKKFARNEERFTAYCGLTIFEFGQLREALDVEIRGGQKRRPGGGRKPKLSLGDRMLAALNYLRTYAVQHVIGANFGIAQSTVSRNIARLIGPMMRCLPRPEMIPNIVEDVATMEESKQLIPGLRTFVDASCEANPEAVKGVLPIPGLRTFVDASCEADGGQRTTRRRGNTRPYAYYNTFSKIAALDVFGPKHSFAPPILGTHAWR